MPRRAVCVCVCFFFCFVCFMEEEGVGSEGPPRAGQSGPCVLATAHSLHSRQGHTQEAGAQPHGLSPGVNASPAPTVGLASSFGRSHRAKDTGCPTSTCALPRQRVVTPRLVL